MRRYFVRVTSGVVDQDLEFDGPDAASAPAPDGLIEVTAHPQWAGLGRLIGATYDALTQAFTVPIPVRRMPTVDFLRLFTRDERIAIRAAAAANENLRDWYELLTSTSMIRLNHPEVTAGLAALQGAGLLTAPRVAAILAGTPPA